ATSLCSFDTGYSADCIEFCPHEGFEHIFVCGTYQVLEPAAAVPVGRDDEDEEEEEEDAAPRQTQRTGRLLLFKVDQDQSTFSELQRIDTAAILDAKWSPHLEGGCPVLAVADAKGGITRYALSTELVSLHSTLERVEVTEDTTLCLSLDYARCPARSASPTSNDLITSLSSGHLTHLTPTPTGYVSTSSWQAHAYEPWIAAWDVWDPNRVWSGGDDCVLKVWDVRMLEIPAGRCKDFEAGVTTIASSPYNEYLLAVGSYDANLRLFDSRSLKSPVRIIPTAGGIWRTKFHPAGDRKGDILLAGMHGGFSMVHLDKSIVGVSGAGETVSEWEATGDEAGSEIIGRFEGHTSLAYGADWCRLPPTAEGSLIISCSFYDHTMHMWR
ncbi:WD40-repeat-containing domain protein, partial [Dioszegia hungarica]